jgi:hypothetical protein
MTGDGLKDLLRRTVELTAWKKSLVEELRRLTSSQSGSLAPEKAEELLSLIDQRQGCINEIDRLDAEVLRLEKKIINTAGLSAREEIKKIFPDQWEEIEKIQSEITLILKETQILDEINRRQVEEEYRKLKSNMVALRAGKGTARAYQMPVAQDQGYFIDKKN